MLSSTIGAITLTWEVSGFVVDIILSVGFDNMKSFLLFFDEFQLHFWTLCRSTSDIRIFESEIRVTKHSTSDLIASYSTDDFVFYQRIF